MEKKISVLNLAEELAQKSNISSAVSEAFIRSFFDVISEGLAQDGLVKIKGWGTFKLSALKDRESVDVSTGERILIKGYRKVSFLPEAALKEQINKPFSQFETTELSDDFQIEGETIEVEEPIDEETTEPAEVVPVVGIADLPDSIEDKKEETEKAVEPEVSEQPVEINEAETNVDVKEEEAVTEVAEEKEIVEEKIEEPITEAAEETVEETIEETIEETVEETIEEKAEEVEEIVEETVEDVPQETEKEKVVKEKKPRKSWKYWLPIFLLILISACLYIYIAFGDGFSKPKFSFKQSKQTENIQVQPIEFDDVARKLKSAIDTQPKAEEKKNDAPKKETKAEPTEVKAEQKTEVNDEAEKADVAETSATEAKPEPQEETKPEVKEEVKAEPKEEAQSSTTEKVKTTPAQEVKPAPKEEVKPAASTASATEKNLKDITLADTTAYSIQGTKATHTIQEGETVVKLAQKYYGDKRFWPYVVKHNGMKNPNNVVVGKTINIPDLKPIN